MSKVGLPLNSTCADEGVAIMIFDCQLKALPIRPTSEVLWQLDPQLLCPKPRRVRAMKVCAEHRVRDAVIREATERVAGRCIGLDAPVAAARSGPTPLARRLLWPCGLGRRLPPDLSGLVVCQHPPQYCREAHQ
jgi:hypothetical protein